MMTATKIENETRVRKPKVLLWGPYPGQGQVFGGGIGGYARCNAQMLRSFLSVENELIPLQMTVPRFRNKLLATLHLVPRMLIDMVVTTAALLWHRPDVLHITALYWRSIYREAWATAVAKLLGVDVLYDIRAGTFENFTLESSSLDRRLLDYVMANATAIAVEGLRYRTFVADTFGRDATWAPNFFLDEDLHRYVPAPLHEPLPGEPFRLGFVGYLIPDKGVDVLLETAWQLAKEIPVELTLVGHVSPQIAPILADYQRRARDGFRVVSTGRLELDEVLATLQKQHVFVFLSRFFGEGHTNAVNEAMAMGLPVVASRQGFLGDVVGDDCGVSIADAEDVGAIKAVLRGLYDNWDDLKAKGRGARRKIETTFNGDVVLRATGDIYEELTAAREGLG